MFVSIKKYHPNLRDRGLILILLSFLSFLVSYLPTLCTASPCTLFVFYIPSFHSSLRTTSVLVSSFWPTILPCILLWVLLSYLHPLLCRSSLASFCMSLHPCLESFFVSLLPYIILCLHPFPCILLFVLHSFLVSFFVPYFSGSKHLFVPPLSLHPSFCPTFLPWILFCVLLLWLHPSVCPYIPSSRPFLCPISLVAYFFVSFLSSCPTSLPCNLFFYCALHPFFLASFLPTTLTSFSFFIFCEHKELSSGKLGWKTLVSLHENRVWNHFLNLILLSLCKLSLNPSSGFQR